MKKTKKTKKRRRRTANKLSARASSLSFAKEESKLYVCVRAKHKENPRPQHSVKKRSMRTNEEEEKVKNTTKKFPQRLEQ